MTRTRMNKIATKRFSSRSYFYYSPVNIRRLNSCKLCLQFVLLFQAEVVQVKLELHLKVCIFCKPLQENSIESLSSFLE